jgi:hypothetical protein
MPATADIARQETATGEAVLAAMVHEEHDKKKPPVGILGEGFLDKGG